MWLILKKVKVAYCGGVQKETFSFERPHIILRPETEWVEIVKHGADMLADAEHDKIISSYHQITTRKVNFPLLFWQRPHRRNDSYDYCQLSCLIGYTLTILKNK